MPTNTSLIALPLFGASLLALAWFSMRISLGVQQVVYNLTGSVDYAVVAYFLLFLPGILVHEAAHWVMAWLLGLKPGKFTLWPKRRGRMVGLGSVTARSGGPLLDSLVGMAPLFVGTLLVALMARAWFGSTVLEESFGEQGVQSWLEALATAFQRPDAALWAWGIFVVANGMMPSAPDREPLRPLFAYIGLAVLLYLFIGLPLQPIGNLLEAGAAPLMRLNSALVVTLLLDVAVLTLLLLLGALTTRRR
jgi:hypothetical protein